jgi:hypothetical protein
MKSARSGTCELREIAVAMPENEPLRRLIGRLFQYMANT